MLIDRPLCKFIVQVDCPLCKQLQVPCLSFKLLVSVSSCLGSEGFGDPSKQINDFYSFWGGGRVMGAPAQPS